MERKNVLVNLAAKRKGSAVSYYSQHLLHDVQRSDVMRCSVKVSIAIVNVSINSSIYGNVNRDHDSD